MKWMAELGTFAIRSDTVKTKSLPRVALGSAGLSVVATPC
jgi:hypothetical protein